MSRPNEHWADGASHGYRLRHNLSNGTRGERLLLRKNALFIIIGYGSKPLRCILDIRS
jgi:hypothetical protein